MQGEGARAESAVGRCLNGSTRVASGCQVPPREFTNRDVFVRICDICNVASPVRVRGERLVAESDARGIEGGGALIVRHTVCRPRVMVRALSDAKRILLW